MKHIKLFEQYIYDLQNRFEIADEKFKNIIFRWFEICFYESHDKRHNPISTFQYSLLSEESKEYLLATLDMIKSFDVNYGRLGKFLDPQTNKPLQSDYELIAYLSCRFFSGKGRGSVLGSSNDIKSGVVLLKPPSQEVVDNIDLAFRKTSHTE